MKKMKIISLLCASAVVASAAPYVGVQVGGYFLKNKNELSGKHKNFFTNTMHDFKVSHDADLNGVRFGVLAGYAHRLKEKLHLMAELDVTFGNKEEKVKFDTTSLKNTASHQNEHTSIKTGLGFGIMPMVRYQMKDKLHGLFGVRFATKQYEVTGYHAQANGTPLADNTKTEKKIFV